MFLVLKEINSEAFCREINSYGIWKKRFAFPKFA